MLIKLISVNLFETMRKKRFYFRHDYEPDMSQISSQSLLHLIELLRFQLRFNHENFLIFFQV